MKVAVECKSPLMQKALELFLAKYLCSVKQSDIVVRDENIYNDDKTFYIATDTEADLIKPFSKSQLILALENRYRTTIKKKNFDTTKEQNEPMNFGILEKRIEYLTKEYQQNILNAVRAFYEK